jgi:DNA repair protein RadC
MPIHSWPTVSSPREKLINHGAKSLSDTELLTIFIPPDPKTNNSNNVPYQLLKRFGGIRNLLDADQKLVCSFPGINQNNYILLQAALEISRRYLEEQLVNTNVISNADTAHLYLAANLRHSKREIFACLFLNSKNQVIHYEELFYGTINNITIHPREIAKIALQYNASGVIFAHNHPTGVPTPSPEDKHLTITLTKILQPLDIRVLDHIIIGNNNYSSLTDR